MWTADQKREARERAFWVAGITLVVVVVLQVALSVAGIGSEQFLLVLFGFMFGKTVSTALIVPAIIVYLLFLQPTDGKGWIVAFVFAIIGFMLSGFTRDFGLVVGSHSYLVPLSVGFIAVLIGALIAKILWIQNHA